MADNPSQIVEDGTSDFSGGQDAYNYPDRIKPTCYAKGVNISVRKGILRSRDGYFHRKLKFEDDTVTVKFRYQRTIKDLFESGKFQAMAPYYVSPEYYLIVVISGLIYRINTRTYNVQLLSKDIRTNELAQRVNWSQAGKYLVIFDYPARPIIIEGDSVTRSNPENFNQGGLEPEVLVSVLGTFNQNRLFVANAGNAFTAGDPVSPSFSEAPITFTEVLTPASAFNGQSFSLGTNSSNEPITAMGFIQAVDQGTGLGPLFVATQNSVYYYKTNLPRTDWETTPDFGSLFLFNAGIVGPRAFVNTNSDVIFLSAEGKVHAFSTSRNDVKTWGNVPMSREVENWLTYSDESLKSLAFLQYFDNRIYIAANPYRVPALTRGQQPTVDYVHGGMVVLELDNSATIQQEDPPVWAGLWTGIRPMDMVVQNTRAFVISKDSTYLNRIYEVMPDTKYDVVDEKPRRIKSIVYTREYDFPQATSGGGHYSTRFINKREQSLSLPIQNVEGELDLLVERRPSQTENFRVWKKWHYNAPYKQCREIFAPNGLAGHRFRELVFGSPQPDDLNEECDLVGGGNSLEAFRKLQLRITIEAHNWQIEEFKIDAIMQDSPNNDNSCDQPNDGIPIPLQCNFDWTNPEETLCQSS